MKLKFKMSYVAILLILIVPLMLTGNATAKYRFDGAVQNATTGAWELPADMATCFGNYSDDADGLSPHDIPLSTVPFGENCQDLTPSWYATTYTTQLDCENASLKWSRGACVNTYTENPAYQTNRDNYECLYCHNGGHGYNMTSYMMTGHKNMLRKVSNGGATGIPQISPEGTPYSSSEMGGVVDWSASTLNGLPLLWIYGDWIDGIPHAPRSVVLDPAGTGSYSCSKCHATGASIDNTVNTAKEPELSFPGITGTGLGQVNLDVNLAGYLSDANASWDQWGIMCSRCHMASTNDGDNYTDQTSCEGAGYTWVAAYHPFCAAPDTELVKWNQDLQGSGLLNMAGTHVAGPSNGPEVVRMCGECHRQETGGQPYTWVGTINGSDGPTVWNKGFGDHAETVIGGLSHGAPSPAVGHNYMNVFLNGAHAKFSGTYGQITDINAYDSDFMKAAADGGHEEPGCMGCHNVHQSLAVDGHEPFENECADCHNGTIEPMKDLNYMMHPTTPGTPGGIAADEGDTSAACEICHMPGALHLFRINTSESYSTKDDYNVTGPDATASDGTYTQAVWNDLDLSCGQCHGGSAGPSATQNGAPYMNKAYLAAIAGSMHQDPPPPPPKYAITVDISPAIGKNTHFILQKCDANFKNCSTKEVGKAIDTYTFKARKIGNYKVKAYKKNYTYDCESTGKPKVKITTTDADVTVTCTHTP